MRRTKEQKEYNKKLLIALFSEYMINDHEAIIGEEDLREGGYKGSYPYPSPTTYGNIWIKQLPKGRGNKWHTYSIAKW